ncbi:MAG: hypothetical protein AAF431_01565 [Pseudomonadota bacterium]
MLSPFRRFTSIVVLILSLIVPIIVSAQTSTGSVCFNNDYALCSHAQCECIDEEGQPGNCTADGLAKCTCPIVRNQQNDNRELETAAYNANYGILRSCDERANPQLTDVLPKFVNNGTVAADVYSEYSYGDSLASRQFGTKSSAQLMICTNNPLMTDCLDAPCIVNDEGVAICYCKNTQLFADQIAIPWNTVGGDCQPQNCDLGEAKVWSAAYVQGTQVAIDAIQKDLLEFSGKFVSEPSYCN